jgi:hypothetical protein
MSNLICLGSGSSFPCMYRSNQRRERRSLFFLIFAAFFFICLMLRFFLIPDGSESPVVQRISNLEDLPGRWCEPET